MPAHYVLLLLVAFVGAADEPKGRPARTDLEKLQGYWKATNAARADPEAANKKIKELRLVFTEKTVSFEWVGQATYEAKYRLDPAKKPKTIDITFITGPDEGKTWHGIYELEGRTLKVCYSRGDTKRPTQLAAKPQAGRYLLTLQRTKP